MPKERYTAGKNRGDLQLGKRNRHHSPGVEWDVIVIGTGLGGSSAGAICALHGLKTLILEKNQRIGGSCSYYEKNGFHIDTGTHLFIRGNKGPFGVCTQRLGMGTPIEFLHTKKTTLFRGINVDLYIPEGRLRRAFITAPILVWQLRISPIHYPALIHLLWDIVIMKQQEIDALDNVTIEEFMFRYTKDPKVRAMFGILMGLFFILPPWQASAGESIWNIQKIIKEDNLGYPRGGAVAIPQTILDGAKSHGAEIRVGAEVKKIEYSKGRVAGVVLKNGDRITSRAVISTTSIGDTVFNLTGSEFFPRPYVERIREIKGSWSAVQAKIALKKPLIKSGSIVGGIPLKFDGAINDNLAHDFISNLEEGIASDMVPIYAPIPTNYDPDLAPEGCQIITAGAAAPTLDIKLRDDSSAWIDGLMRALYSLIPGLKENIIFCDTWSVKKISSWIGKMSGSAVTTGQSVKQVRGSRPEHHTPVKGLYIAGDCGGYARGVGTELACQSGMDCGDMVARDLYGDSK